ncbi:MAG: arginine--tRNA ligase [Candidatus Marinimicrobia bacterium]|jgi:arginyl-tRNA synthetase|nr:arginine--tRNA ligase [Candidatus Neomarinimicrobiota bacterium]
MNLKTHLSEAITEVLFSLDLPKKSIIIEPPKKGKFGDFSCNIALILAKEIKKNPIQIAQTITDNLILNPEWVSSTNVTPPGFINFFISLDYYQSFLTIILSKGNNFGKSSVGIGKTANVEFVSANPTGPLTVGHGRQAVLGDTISNILEWHKYDVTREYYYNDAGRQMRILSDSVSARYFQETNPEVKFPEEGYRGEYIREIAKNILQNHGENLKADNPIFRREAEESIFLNIKQSLMSLGIQHNSFVNEKSFYESGSIEKILEDLNALSLIYEKDGATWFKATDCGKTQDRVYIKNTGEPTYRLPDTAYHRNKFERNYDLIIDIFGADHVDTFPDVLAALEALDYDLSYMKVCIHQFVTLIRSGEKVKMSTRKAEFITLQKLIDQLGLDVVRYFFIMRSMNSHLNFDLDLATDQSEKNPVFYLQYAHARICNVLRYAEKSGYVLKNNFDKNLLDNPSEIDLIRSLHQFPEIMLNVLESLEPQTIATYLQSLAGKYHKFYTDCRVVSEDKALTNSRLNLICAVKLVLANGLIILGISAPERM